VAGESAVEVVEDERGDVKFFVAEKEIKRMKAFGGRCSLPLYSARSFQIA
jgi:hypothetical protein